MTLSALRCAAAAALVLAGCRKPPPDPAEAAYHHAVELFAKASAETHDLTYRDPRFDEVLQALAAVPQGDELRPKADALAQQIREGREQGEALDEEAKRKVDSALAAPDFVPLPKDATMPAPPPRPAAAQGSEAPAATPDWPWSGVGAKPAAGGHAGYNPQPAYYRHMADFHPAPGMGDNETPAPPPPELLAPPEPPPPPPPTQAPQAQPPPAPQGPPPVYGLPGPAGRAMMGHP